MEVHFPKQMNQTITFKTRKPYLKNGENALITNAYISNSAHPFSKD